MEPANKEFELKPMNDSHQSSPVFDDETDADRTTADPIHFMRQTPRSKVGSYDVSNEGNGVIDMEEVSQVAKKLTS